jgi:hypothetical protein
LAATSASAAARAGYRPLGDFVLPASEWWDDYCTSFEERLNAIRDERTDPVWAEIIAELERELGVVREGLDSFGVVFYTAEIAER